MTVSSAPQVENKEENRSCTMNGTVSEEHYVENRVKVTVGNASKAVCTLRLILLTTLLTCLLTLGAPFQSIRKN